MKLSLCIATYDEEKFIHYPLDSCIDFVDEVVIVDGASSDKTVEITKSYGKKVKVFVEKHEEMFHKNKQKAIERAGGEWILQLDADEAVSDELKQEIISLISQSQLNQLNQSKPIQPNTDLTDFNRFVAFYIPRKNFFLTRFLTKGGIYPDYTIRLYRNGCVKFPCKSVHENVELVIPSEIPSEQSKSRDPSKIIGYLKNPLLHYADPDFSRYLVRWNRYTSMDAQLLIEANKKPNFFDYFLVKPSLWFLKTYFRHRGFQDGFPGFVFALFSSLRFWAVYIKTWQMRKSNVVIARNVVTKQSQ